MIRIVIKKTPLGEIRSFTMDGHADFGKHGQDIVCAGASAVSFGSINAIISLTGINPEIDLAQNGGSLRFAVPDQIPEEKKNQVQLLLKAMVISLQTIERDYKKYIRITFKK